MTYTVKLLIKPLELDVMSNSDSDELIPSLALFDLYPDSHQSWYSQNYDLSQRQSTANQIKVLDSKSCFSGNLEARMWKNAFSTKNLTFSFQSHEISLFLFYCHLFPGQPLCKCKLAEDKNKEIVLSADLTCF